MAQRSAPDVSILPWASRQMCHLNLLRLEPGKTMASPFVYTSCTEEAHMISDKSTQGALHVSIGFPIYITYNQDAANA